MTQDNNHTNYLVKKIQDIATRAMEKSKNQQEQSFQENKTETQGKLIKLPSCIDSERTIPNIIARSALFGVIKRGARSYKNRELIASRDDVEIYYTGKTLDQADCTVWMQALAFATVLGKDTPVNRSLFLKLLGKTTGKKDYLWLNASLNRLMTGVVTIRTSKYELEFHLIDLWGRFKDEEHANEYYLLNINPRVIKMWANSEYTRVKWEKRLAIKRGCDLASWMQLYIRSNSNTDKPHHISLEKLKKWCGLSNMRLRQYKVAMMRSLNELVRIGEIKDISIRRDGMVIFTRIADSNSNAPHRDSNAPHRDSNAPDHRDSNALYRDSNALYRDSNAPHLSILLNIKRFLSRFPL
jgi:TrfA protein